MPELVYSGEIEFYRTLLSNSWDNDKLTGPLTGVAGRRVKLKCCQLLVESFFGLLVDVRDCRAIFVRIEFELCDTQLHLHILNGAKRYTVLIPWQITNRGRAGGEYTKRWRIRSGNGKKKKIREEVLSTEKSCSIRREDLWH